MSTSLGRLLIIVTMLAVASSVIAGGQTKPKKLHSVDEVLDRYIAALGGRVNIEKLDTRVCLGRVTTDLPSYKPPVYESSNFQTFSKVPDHTLFMTLVDGTGFKTGYNGEIGWAQDKCSVRRDNDVKTDKLHWLANPQGALLLKQYYGELKFAGEKQTKGHAVYSLEPVGMDPQYWSLSFDVTSGLLVGIGAYWELEDYRSVDGVLFPHRILTSRKGGQTWYEFFEVNNNVAVEDLLFEMPTENGK